MLLKPVQVEYYQNRAAQMCSFLTEIKFCCGHRHSGSRRLPFLFPGRVNLQNTRYKFVWLIWIKKILGLPSSRPPHSEHEPQVYHALTRALGLQVWIACAQALLFERAKRAARASRACTFHDIPQMESLLAG